jgi:hypothetical protein
MSLLTILSTEYGEKCGQLFPRGRAGRCDIFTHGKFFLTDQGLNANWDALLTILSTENVQNGG